MSVRVQTRVEDRAGWGFPASIALHVLILLAALLVSPASPLLKPPPEKTVEVDILSPDQFQAATQPAPAPPVLTTPVAPSPAATPPAQPDAPPDAAPGMVRATTMLSARSLADPRAKQARADLATFADSERIVQLCNLEAMDQIEAWKQDFRPDNLVAYARSNEKMAGDVIKAEGAAFHSRKRWYDLKFNCQVAPTHDKVVAFEFQVGKPVPKKDWEDLGLPSGEAQD